ncbi:MAG: ABC transporter permease, partial [Atribacterota bacterium]|nr:ABC transporter permease [Atribacterota bacterium]
MFKKTVLIIKEGTSKAYFKPVLFLAVALVLATAISPHFLTIRNIRAILISASPLMIVAVGEAIVVLTGMIDLGCESVLASSGVLIATMDLMLRFPTVISFTLTLAFGLLIG